MALFDRASEIVGALETIIIYDPAVFEDNTGGLSAIGTIAQGIFGGIATNRLYRFRINPATKREVHRTILAYRKTDIGYDTMIGGEQIVPIVFSGSTDHLLPWEIFVDLGITDQRLSPAWISWQRFKSFYQVTVNTADHLHMIFSGFLIEGHLADVTEEEDHGTDPHRIRYTFTFNALPNKISGLTSLLPPGLQGMLNVMSATVDVADALR